MDLGHWHFHLCIGAPQGAPSPELATKRRGLATVIGTAGGMALIVLDRQRYLKLAGVALLAVPHLVGAPHAESGAALAPADLARRFVFATAWTNGLFWLLLGSVSAWIFRRLGRV